ncbi:hypothetical protein NFI96_024342 [Prochilodus magdalenae]|nr:hypothetical protein NFI96_024342 [Prochilodus magdalenae]
MLCLLLSVMASSSSLLSEDQLLCSICLDVFTDPVTTSCGHNFCMVCLNKCWDSSSHCQCPVCKTDFTRRPDLCVNTFIAGLAAQFKETVQVKPSSSSEKPARSQVLCDICSQKKSLALKSCLICKASYCNTHLEPHQRVSAFKSHKLMEPVENLEDYICQKHERPLELFCRDDQTCVCQFCTETDHKTHSTVPIEEESGEKKTQLEKSQAEVQQMIQDRLKKIEEVKHSVELSKKNTEQEKADSMEVFRALVRCIERSQAELLELMEEKQEAAERQAEELIKELEQEITELKRRDTELEQLSHTEDHLHLLQVYPSLCRPPHTNDWTDLCIDTYLCLDTVIRALSQFQEELTNEMRKLVVIVDVTLDPDTAFSELILSDDGKQVKDGGRGQDLPDNPERFNYYPCVLGKEGFCLGRFYYEVQVTGKTQWALGVTTESSDRKGLITPSPETGHWSVCLRYENVYEALDLTPVLFSLNQAPQKVGVFVDYEKGLVSFYDVEAKSYMYSFTVMASSSSLLSEDQLLCSICLDVFTDPVSTSCGHNFCRVCLKDCWDSSSRCQCPVCKEEFSRRPELRVNTFISGLAAQFKKSVQVKSSRAPEPPPSKPKKVLCDSCNEEKLEAVKSCLDCGVSYCDAHLMPHTTAAKLKKHKLMEPVENLEDYICQKHERPLELFCRDDQTCVCQFCTETDHKTHSTVPIEEESGEKTQLEKSQAEVQQMIQDRLKKIEEVKHSVELSKVSVTVTCFGGFTRHVGGSSAPMEAKERCTDLRDMWDKHLWTTTTLSTVGVGVPKSSPEKVTEQEKADSVEVFRALVHCIERSQAELLELMEEKQEAAERQAEELIKELEQEITELKRRDTELEQLSHTEDHLHLLQVYPSLCRPPPTKDWTDLRIDTPLRVERLRRALSQLQESIKLKVVQLYAVDVTLDPNTAHPALVLSDGKQVRDGDTEQDLPYNRRRFNECIYVLGEEGFSSGRFYYEVQVSGAMEWALGVTRESSNRKGNITLGPENGYWTMSMSNGTEYAALDCPSVPLSLKQRPQKIGVFVDYEEGLVSFYDVGSRSHIYSFTVTCGQTHLTMWGVVMSPMSFTPTAFIVAFLPCPCLFPPCCLMTLSSSASDLKLLLGSSRLSLQLGGSPRGTFVTPVMASSSCLLFEDQLQCSICLDLFTDPVSTPCGHNFCMVCLRKCWNSSPRCQCPVCKKEFPTRPELSVNTFISGLAAHFTKPVQVKPRRAPEERPSRVKKVLFGRSVSTEKQSGDLKTRLRKTQAEVQQMIQDRQKKTVAIKRSVELSKKVTEQEKADSVEVFRALVHCIERSQAELLELMEEKQKAAERQAEEFIKELEQEITELKRRDTELEQLSHTEDHLHLLQVYPSLCRPPPTKDWTDVSIDTPLSVENLRRALSQLQEVLSKKMEKLVAIIKDLGIGPFYLDVTLDPATSHPDLILSDDGKQVRDGDTEQDLPNNPERFDYYPCVLGKEGFSSGRFYYEVQVSGKTKWALGVTTESSTRKGELTFSPEDGYWIVCLTEDVGYIAVDSSPVLLSLKQAPQKVGVFVEFTEGLVSFYDVEARAHIFSFTGQSFTERLYPYFNPCDSDGVSTPCGHNFCMVCLKECWDSSSRCQCPVCKKEFPTRPELCVNTFISGLAAQFKKSVQVKPRRAPEAPPSRVKKVLCDSCSEEKLEAVKSCLDCGVSYCDDHLALHKTTPKLKKHKLMEPVENLEDYICQKHERPLELFCRDDQTCVCQFCTETDHRSHRTVPIEEESGEKKTQLEKSQAEVQQMIQDRLKKIEEVKHSVELSKKGTEQEKADSVEVFRALVRCIERSQAELLELMEEKQEAAERQAEELIKELEQEITELKRRDTELEQLSHTEDHLHLLQVYPSLCRPPHTKDWTDLRINTPLRVERLRRALSQLQEELTKEMEKLPEIMDVTLDPDTAHPKLVLSDDGKQVTCGDRRQDLPDNPERFDYYTCVLGKEGFSSGRFYYEVQVSGKTVWAIGVTTESSDRKGVFTLSPEKGYWTVWLRNETEYKALDYPPVKLSLENAPQKVGVFVDYAEGLVSFYDVEAGSLIYSFTAELDIQFEASPEDPPPRQVEHEADQENVITVAELHLIRKFPEVSNDHHGVCVSPPSVMASSSSLLSEDQLLCSICLDVFTDPATTPCGHNFCMVCLKECWDSSSRCQCPVCKKEFPTRPELSVNTFISGLAAQFKKSVQVKSSRAPEEPPSKPKKVLCESCSEEKLEAVKSCLDCGMSYCDAHLMPHKTAAKLKKHKLMEPVENLEDYICQKHERPLELFCRDDQTCVCQFCTEGDHRSHSTVPIEEESGERKTQLEKSQAEVQQMIQDRLKKIEEVKHSVELSKVSRSCTMVGAVVGAVGVVEAMLGAMVGAMGVVGAMVGVVGAVAAVTKNTEQEKADSVEVFRALVRCIERSQAELLELMEEKQEAAERQAEELIKELEQEITELKRRDTELEQLSHTEDHLHLLQVYPSLCRPPPTKDWTDLHINTPLRVESLRRALSQLQEELSKEMEKLPEIKMKRIQLCAVDVTLDPDTANPKLVLSDDGKQVTCGDRRQDLPDNPERFDCCVCVLGKEGFSSGRFYYEVQVRKTEWDLGVVRESSNRKGAITLSPKDGYWTVWLRNETEYEALDSPSVTLSLKQAPQKVGVFVDYEEGLVSFYDVEARSHIYSFTGQSFTEKLYPYFSPCSNAGGRNSAPLIITPVEGVMSSRNMVLIARLQEGSSSGRCYYEVQVSGKTGWDLGVTRASSNRKWDLIASAKEYSCPAHPKTASPEGGGVCGLCVMASSSSLLSEDQLLCSICLDVFTDPVSTPCGHNFCMVCLKECWDSSSRCQCPVCKKEFPTRPDLSVNTFISGLAAQFKKSVEVKSSRAPEEPPFRVKKVLCDSCSEEKQEAVKSCLDCGVSYCDAHLALHKTTPKFKKHKLMEPVENLEDYICQKHERPLELFCRDDQTCVCQFCTEGDHRSHSTVPIEEESGEKKTQLEKSQAEVQQMIQDRLKKIEEVKHSVELSKKNTEQEKADSVEVFRALVRCIERSQAELLELMEEKQGEAERQAEEFIKELEQEITELKRRDTELEQLSHTEDHLHLLQVYPSLCRPPPTKDWTDLRINTPLRVESLRRALSQLQEELSKEMEKLPEISECVLNMDVTLDPDTANPALVLSDDGKQVTCGDRRQDLPDNPERFDYYTCVLGKEGFSSGRFYYEVQVSGKTAWDLGVTTESSNRKGRFTLWSPEDGYWRLQLRNETEYKALDSPSVKLSLEQAPQKVGVFVDHEEGLVSFYDVEAGSHIYSFTGQSFTEKLYPFFSPSPNAGVMASSSSLLSEDQLLCSICLDVFTDPATTPCGHNFCMVCLKECWDSSSHCQCPVCKEEFSRRPELRVNTFISGLAAQFKKTVQVKSSRAPEKRPSRVKMVLCDYCSEKKLEAVKSCLDCGMSYCDTHLIPHKTAAKLKKHKLMEPVENLEDYICQKHERPLELFCRDDQTCVCQFCTETDHKTHRTVPIEEESGRRKPQLRKTQAEVQQMIQDRLKKIEEIKHSIELSKKITEQEKADSVEVFRALVRCIERTKTKLLVVLEEKQKAAERQAEEFIKELEQEITKLKRRDTELEQLSHTEDHLHLLQVYPSLCRPPHTKDWTDLRINTPLRVESLRRALSQLQEELSKEMEKLPEIMDVTLDPDTAHPDLILSDDGKQVRHGDTEQDLPDNPERFDRCVCVLGKEGFSSGRFYYEVQVSGKTEWDLGVTTESSNRKGVFTLSPEDGYWTVCLRNETEYEAADTTSVTLSLEQAPQKVGVFVDYAEGLVSFYDVQVGSLIYSFTGQSFTEKLYPYFSPCFNDGGNIKGYDIKGYDVNTWPCTAVVNSSTQMERVNDLVMSSRNMVLIARLQEGSSSGRCYYEVQVSGKTGWDLGVTRASSNRKWDLIASAKEYSCPAHPKTASPEGGGVCGLCVMASSSSLLSEDQLLCSICLDVFTDPATTPCGHNFCMVCLKECWDSSSRCQCPVCKEEFSRRPELRVNTFISGLAAQFKKSVQVKSSRAPEEPPSKPKKVLCDSCSEEKLEAVKSCLDCGMSYCDAHLMPHKTAAKLKKHKLMEPVENLEDYICQKHERPLELFCRDDQTCVCQFCTETDHRSHSTVPIEEESGEKKTQLEKSQAEVQQMIQDRLKKIEEVKHSVELSKKNTEQEKADSVEVFRALVRCIERSQVELLELMEEKQEAAERQAEELIKELEQEITELKRRDTELEQLSHTEDHLHLLQVYPSLCRPPPTKDWTDLRINTPVRVETQWRALSQLQEELSKEMEKLPEIKMKRIQLCAVDVTLDPDTANPYLVLSDDGKQVTCGDTEQDLPDNPERFDKGVCVLGKEGFSSGRFYYEVQVSGKTKWDLGVVRESINRKGKITLSPEDGYWTVWLRNETEYKALDSPRVTLSLKQAPQKVGVFVDYEEGLVSFYDVEAGSHIYSYTGQSFTEKLYPYFSPCSNAGGRNSAPLIITPLEGY